MERQVIEFHYTLRNKMGEVLDQTPSDRPLEFLEGAGMLIEGLESKLAQLDPGSKEEVLVRPEKGYGFRDESLIDRVAREKLPLGKLEVGDFFQAGNDRHSPVVRVVAIDGDEVTLDANHPLAGQDLFFSVEVLSKRGATGEELSHQHVHDDGGCCGGGGGCGCSH